MVSGSPMNGEIRAEVFAKRMGKWNFVSHLGEEHMYIEGESTDEKVKKNDPSPTSRRGTKIRA